MTKSPPAAAPAVPVAPFSPVFRLERPEILAPAGDEESLDAAIAGGADAVYFGLQGFNARARAKNFDEATLGKTLDKLHAHGVKGYVTLNTLVFDDELELVENAIRACAAAGVDAIIVQDIGVAKIAAQIAPTLPIHASTQMTCTDAAGVTLAHELGATRVILARELSAAEAGTIREKAPPGIELETFVHGALCIAYSGQCLTSEAIGGRSANRGACAQACRLPYELVVDGELRDTGDDAYLLSPQDLEGTEAVPALIEAGVRSLKIEGRLKGPAYVGASARLYRAAVDKALADREAGTSSSRGLPRELREASLQAFSRGSGPGFLNGVDHQRLVEGRACDHRGLIVGRTVDTSGVGPRGRARLDVLLEAPLARGDGILVEGGWGGEGELGGRVWSLSVDGADVEAADAGMRVSVWLGPEKDLSKARAGRVWKTDDPRLDAAVQRSLVEDPHREALTITIAGAFGEPFTLAATSRRGLSASVQGDANVELATNRPLTVEVLQDKLGRLGETPFVLDAQGEGVGEGGIVNHLPDGAIVPLSALNRARRALTDALIASAARVHPTTEVHAREIVALPPERAPLPAGLFVLCRTLDQARAALAAGAAGIYLDFLELKGLGAAVATLREEGAARGEKPFLGVAPPRIRKPGEETIDRYLLGLSPDALLVRSLGSLQEIAAREIAAGGGPICVGDFSLNVTNRLTAAFVLAKGCAAFTPSFDLDIAQTEALLTGPFGPYAELVIHHPMPLFHMEHCVFAALLSNGADYKTCGRPCDRHQISLRDRAGMDHPVEADVGCRNTVFHAHAQSAAALVERAQAAGTTRFRVELVRETAADVAAIVEAYQGLLAGKKQPDEVFRSLRTEGGYGVVRGSLRLPLVPGSHQASPAPASPRTHGPRT
jgi:U32 family peptidase